MVGAGSREPEHLPPPPFWRTRYFAFDVLPRRPYLDPIGQRFHPVKTSYDRSTDSLYIERREIPSSRTIELEENVFLDLGADDEPVGYDIQHASTKRDLVARIILGQQLPEAAE